MGPSGAVPTRPGQGVLSRRNLPCEAKADLSETPNDDTVVFCKENPNAEVVPAAPPGAPPSSPGTAPTARRSRVSRGAKRRWTGLCGRVPVCDRAIARQRHSVTVQRSDLHSRYQYKKRLHSQALFVLMFDSAPTVWCVGVNLAKQVGVRWALLSCPKRAIH